MALDESSFLFSCIYVGKASFSGSENTLTWWDYKIAADFVFIWKLFVGFNAVSWLMNPLIELGLLFVIVLTGGKGD